MKLRILVDCPGTDSVIDDPMEVANYLIDQMCDDPTVELIDAEWVL